MSLLQENRKIESSSKKIYMMCGIGIIILLFIIVALLAMVSSINKNKVKLYIDGQNRNVKEFLISKDDTIYIGLESLTKAIANDGYTYRRGNRDIEDENQCYITDSALQESVFFKVGSNEIYKANENSNEVVHYTISKPVIKENEKIYIPIEDCKNALNMKFSKNNNEYTISTIEYLEKYYNKQASNNFVPDTSIVWDTLAANKKLLREGMVVIKDGSGNLGIAFVSSSTDSKKKITKVSTSQLITPKYKYIKYVEKYNQLIVETQSGRGIVELNKAEDGSFSIKTIVTPQYDDILQLDEDRFIISKVEGEGNSKATKYGIINKDGEELLPVEYQKIGVNASQFTNNNLENEFIVFDYLIPVKKNNLWGFVNLKGQTIIDMIYTDLGCTESNPSSNVLIIPNEELIVVKSDTNYGIINKTGKIFIKPVLTKVYKENEDGTDKYYMIYNDKKVDIEKYYQNNNLKTTVSENNSSNENNKESEEKIDNSEKTTEETEVEEKSENIAEENQD